MPNSDDHPVQFTTSHERQLADIHRALTGSPELGSQGLVARVDGIERQSIANAQKLESHGRIFWFVTVLGGGIWAFLSTFKDVIFGHNGK